MAHHISVIIPNHNGEATLEKCLSAVFASDYDNFEVIVVDDFSKDNSVSIINTFPCRLICMEKHAGASAARNKGAEQSKGNILFFTDADCVLEKNTLSLAAAMAAKKGPDTIVGGTYTKQPYDPGFFNLFQSIFIHYSEVKHKEAPDYIATHALIVHTDTFKKIGGFPQNFLPILEDVEFCHRARRKGFRLIMEPKILVRHIFNFSMSSSLRNAYKKSKFWTLYSLKNHDLLADSGTASVELKFNVLACFFAYIFFLLTLASQNSLFLVPSFLFIVCNVFVNRKLFGVYFENGGLFFLLKAVIYYMTLYPLAVGLGGIAGLTRAFTGNRP